jgi:hypothetical protein
LAYRAIYHNYKDVNKKMDLSKLTSQQIADMQRNTKIEIVTPEMAEKWLEGASKLEEAGLGGNYRKLRPSWVNKIAQYVDDQTYMFNGDSIKLGVEIPLNGKLFRKIPDGQHRLSGVVKGGKPVTTLVWYDCPQEVVKWIDSDRHLRNAADALTINGLGSTLEGAMARAMCSLSKGRHASVPIRRVVDIVKENQQDIIRTKQLLPHKTTRSGGSTGGATVRAAFAYLNPIYPDACQSLASRFMNCNYLTSGPDNACLLSKTILNHKTDSGRARFELCLKTAKLIEAEARNVQLQILRGEKDFVGKLNKLRKENNYSTY